MTLEGMRNRWLQPDEFRPFLVDGEITIYDVEHGDIKIYVNGRLEEDGFIGEWYFMNDIKDENEFKRMQSYVNNKINDSDYNRQFANIRVNA